MTTVHRLPTHPRCRVIPEAQPTSKSGTSTLVPVLRLLSDLGPAPALAFTKGAVDGLLEIATRVWVDDRTEPLDTAWRQQIARANEALARDGMRVLGVACRALDAVPSSALALNGVECNLTFLGLVGMIDPPRPEVKAAVQTCKSAGIRPLMITGDHPLTAQYIAHELGLAGHGRVLTGQELERLSVEDLRGVVEEVSVYARVSPEHKLKVVQALQERGHTVAMTRDGVNDAPALKQADIGVAMGLTGTDVSKEAADMVLRDDNFATIVAAVDEGRVMYDNVRKFLWQSRLVVVIAVSAALMALKTGWPVWCS
jgi:P-type Ca2+ transporter type 2C